MTDPEATAREHLDGLKKALYLKDGFTLKELDAVVLGGDFTWTESLTGFAIAEHFIRLLRSELQPAVPIILIPGNHDVHLQPAVAIGGALLPPDFSLQQRPFQEFAASLSPIVVPISDDGSSFVRIAKPGVGEMLLVGLNSTRAECRDAQGVGWVGLDQIGGCLRRLLAAGSPEGAMMVSVLHHHLLPVGNAR
jgi:hypothetical protein